ncbi:MAG: hypothetical protein ABSA65_14960 [Acidimicrobiales bacterium]|jgi:hypothetical protein
MSDERWEADDPDLVRAREIVLSILKLDTSSHDDEQSALRTITLSDDFLRELKSASERLKLMSAWSAVILLEVAVYWIARLTDTGTTEIVDALSKTFDKPSDAAG